MKESESTLDREERFINIGICVHACAQHDSWDTFNVTQNKRAL